MKEIQTLSDSFDRVAPTKDDQMMELIAQTDLEIKRLGWSLENCRKALMEVTGGKQGKRSRLLCTNEELEKFLNYLKNQPTP